MVPVIRVTALLVILVAALVIRVTAPLVILVTALVIRVTAPLVILVTALVTLVTAPLVILVTAAWVTLVLSEGAVTRTIVTTVLIWRFLGL